MFVMYFHLIGGLCNKEEFDNTYRYFKRNETKIYIYSFINMKEINVKKIYSHSQCSFYQNNISTYTSTTFLSSTFCMYKKYQEGHVARVKSLLQLGECRLEVFPKTKARMYPTN